MSDGTISYIEIGSGAEPGKSATFFANMFNWRFEPMDASGNGWFQTPTIRAGMHPNDPAPGIYLFFGVADLPLAIAKVRELGGEASDPGPEEPGFGQFSMCRDPQGITFGLHLKPNA